tara:strand:- start:55 stop:192 length:138 start_codon:yes stop_codon:yes gene_type:complete
MINDRITEDADWRDGMDQFRIRILEELKIINEELEKLNQKKGETP